MSRSRSPWLVAVLVSLTLPLVAHVRQTGVGTPGGPQPIGISYGVVVAGELTRDGVVDAVVLESDEPVLLVDPETYRTELRAGEDANDIALLPDGAASGADALLAVGAAGLRRLEWARSGPSDPGAWAGTTLAAGAWLGARAVRTGFADDTDTLLDVFGLQDDALDPGRVLVLVGDGAGGYDEAASFDTAFPAYALEVLDWDGDGVSEVAAFTSYGVEIWSSDGTPLHGTAWSASELPATVIGVPGSARQELVLAARSANGAQEWICVLGSTRVEIEPLPGPPGVVALAAADLDQDGDDDVVLSVTSAPELIELENHSGEPGAATFDPQTALHRPIGDPERDATANRAGIACADFDRDHDQDILFPVQPDAPGASVGTSIALVRGEANDHTVALVEIEDSVYTFDDVELDGVLTLTLLPPAQLLEAGPGQTRMLEVVVWTTPDLGEDTDPTAFLSRRVPLPSDGPPEERQIAFATGQPTFAFPTLHSLELTQVVVDGTNAVVTRGPTLTVIYATVENLGEVAELDDVQTVVVVENGTPAVPGGSTASGGGLAMPPPIPPYGEDDVPSNGSIWQ